MQMQGLAVLILLTILYKVGVLLQVYQQQLIQMASIRQLMAQLTQPYI